MSPHGDVMLTDGLQKGEGEDCPKCKGGKLNKMGQCMKMGCGGKMAKAEPGFKAEKITDVNPAFMSETGGQTKSGYFTTNGRTIETEDAKPKRAKDNKKVDLGKLGGRMNPHAGTYDLWNLWWDTKKWLFATQWYGYTRLPSIHIAMIGGD